MSQTQLFDQTHEALATLTKYEQDLTELIARLNSDAGQAVKLVTGGWEAAGMSPLQAKTKGRYVTATLTSLSYRLAAVRDLIVIVKGHCQRAGDAVKQPARRVGPGPRLNV